MHFVINKQSILIIDNQSNTHNISADFPTFDEIRQEVLVGNYEKALGLFDLGNALQEYFDNSVKDQSLSATLSVDNGEIKYRGSAVNTSLTQRILSMMGEKEDVTAMVNFLENLMLNPSKRAVDELYTFLSVNELPITPDGHFMAYKNVRDDYKDKHSGTFDNSVGKTVEMERNGVDDNKENTCSSGLHFCSIEYLTGMWGTTGRNMLVKIHPKDVVSIPVDYNNSKGRCCRYEVVAEVDFTDGAEDVLTESSVYRSEDPDEHSTYSEGYNDGHEDGYNEGYDSGYSDGSYYE